MASLWPQAGLTGVCSPSACQHCFAGHREYPAAGGFALTVALLAWCIELPCSPSLSSSQTFQVDVVEAWLLLPPEDEQYSQQGSSSTTPTGSKTGAYMESRTRVVFVVWQHAGNRLVFTVKPIQCCTGCTNGQCNVAAGCIWSVLHLMCSALIPGGSVVDLQYHDSC